MKNTSIAFNDNFKIDFLDHVAIRVKNIEASAQWYVRVLGLKKYRLAQWGDFPIFLLAGKSGLALFPANDKDPPLHPFSKNIKIDHFAFHVTADNFEKAKKRYEQLGINYDFQDHHYFHSIYIKDPDGHTVELTTLKVDEQSFYQFA